MHFSEKYQEIRKDKSIDRARRKEIKAAFDKKRRMILWTIIVINFGMLAVLKYLHPFFEGFLIPLGISFYMFISIGYLVDIYFEKYEAEKNPFRFLLFVSFFPQLIQGPINRYDQMKEQLYGRHTLDWYRCKRALILILFGLLKKYTIANLLVHEIANILDAPTEKTPGSAIVFAILLYSAQQYADFSGGIDIVMGVAELFGIEMMPNFRQPYFSKNLGEFWRRWHISLGTWMKDYIFYPFSISKHMLHFGKFAKKRFGKTTGRVLPICLANILIFFIVGVWHGASWKYILYGFYNGIIIALSNLLKPVYASMAKKCHINTSSRYWKVVSIIRTFIIVNIGWLFDACLTAELAFKAFTGIFRGFTFSVLANGSLLRLGLNMRDYKILIVGTVILFITSVMKEKGINLREFVAQRPLVVRWALYIILIFATAPFGYVGGTTEFVYAQF